MCEQQKYLINIGNAYILNGKGGFKTAPATQVEIGEEVYSFIQQFANVSIINGLTKLYKINSIEFTIVPKFEMDDEG